MEKAKNLKKVLVCGAALLMFASVGASSASNINVNARHVRTSRRAHRYHRARRNKRSKRNRGASVLRHRINASVRRARGKRAKRSKKGRKKKPNDKVFLFNGKNDSKQNDLVKELETPKNNDNNNSGDSDNTQYSVGNMPLEVYNAGNTAKFLQSVDSNPVITQANKKLIHKLVANPPANAPQTNNQNNDQSVSDQPTDQSNDQSNSGETAANHGGPNADFNGQPGVISLKYDNGKKIDNMIKNLQSEINGSPKRVAKKAVKKGHFTARQRRALNKALANAKKFSAEQKKNSRLTKRAMAILKARGALKGMSRRQKRAIRAEANKVVANQNAAKRAVNRARTYASKLLNTKVVYSKKANSVKKARRAAKNATRRNRRGKRAKRSKRSKRNRGTSLRSRLNASVKKAKKGKRSRKGAKKAQNKNVAVTNNKNSADEMNDIKADFIKALNAQGIQLPKGARLEISMTD